MKSSIQKKSQSFGCSYITVVTNAAIAAIKNNQKDFTLGRRKQLFHVITHFASVNGWLSPAGSNGYKHSLYESYDNYKLKVLPGSATRMFYVVYNNLNNPLVVINTSMKTVEFSNELFEKEPGLLSVDTEGIFVEGFDAEEEVALDVEIINIPSSPEFLAELRAKTEEVFFLKEARSKINPIYSWEAFVLGSNDQGGVTTLRSGNTDF